MSSAAPTSGSKAVNANANASAAGPLKLSTRFLGTSGVLVSEFCLGAMTLTMSGSGAWGLPGTDQKTSFQLLDRFVEVGGNFIDTADAYDGSEECIGEWLASKRDVSGFRDKLVLATKVRGATGTGPNDEGLSRKHILANVERSLKLLQTPFIDLYQLHMWDNRSSIYDVMRTMNDLVRAGKVRNIGFSNFTAWQAQRALEYAKFMGLEPFVSNQAQYSLLCRSAEFDLIPQCLDSENQLAFLPWSPLAGGWLSGKYRRGIREPPKDSRVAWAEAVGWAATSFKSHAQDQTFDVIEELYSIGEQLKVSPAAVALRWAAQRPGVTSVIIGAKTVQQLNDNLQASAIQLTEQHMARLTELSEQPKPYPWGMVAARAR